MFQLQAYRTPVRHFGRARRRKGVGWFLSPRVAEGLPESMGEPTRRTVKSRPKAAESAVVQPDCGGRPSVSRASGPAATPGTAPHHGVDVHFVITL